MKQLDGPLAGHFGKFKGTPDPLADLIAVWGVRSETSEIIPPIKAVKHDHIWVTFAIGGTFKDGDDFVLTLGDLQGRQIWVTEWGSRAGN